MTASLIVRPISLFPVWEAIDCSGATSDSRLIPSGVISKAQEKPRAIGKPMASKATRIFMAEAGASKVGRRIDAAWMRSHETTT